MQQTEQQQAAAIVLGRVLEAIGTKLQQERGLTREQVGAAMVQAGLNALSEAWPADRLVRFLATVTGSLMEAHNVDPATGEAGVPPTRN